MTDAEPRHCPSRADLDDLELLRRGLYGPGAAPQALPLPAGVAAAARAAGSLLVTDAEGTPVVRLDAPLAPDPAQPDALTGTPQWLAPPPPRPFEALHPAAPVDLGDRHVVVVEAGAGPPAGVAPDDTLLVLASTSVDGPSAGTDTVRAALAVAGTVAHVVVAPLPRATRTGAAPSLRPGARPGPSSGADPGADVVRSRPRCRPSS